MSFETLNQRVETCINLDRLLETERVELNKAIEENKYYRSQEAHYDIGFKAAKNDFLKNHIRSWGKNKKQYFCNNVCEFSYACIVKETDKDNCAKDMIANKSNSKED